MVDKTKIEGVRLVLHPGMPKCGSSSIQASLICNLKILQKAKIFILDKHFRIRDEIARADPHGIPYSIIFECLNDERNLEFELRECCRKIKEKHNIDAFDLVLSSELLSFIGTERGFKFHTILSRLFENNLVLIAIRAPWDQQFSHWRQSDYRKGLSFDKYVELYRDQNGTSGKYWNSRIEKFVELYKKVRVISLDTNGSFVDEFYKQILEQNIDLKKIHSKSNRSLSPVFCEVLSKYPEFFKDEVNDNRNVLKRHKNVLDSAVPSNSFFFSNDVLPEHSELIDQSKKHFLDEYFVVLDKYSAYSSEELETMRDKLSYNRKYKVIETDVDKLTERMLVELVSNLKNI